jgi:formylmethanofuran dehydrogenase subunit C
MALRLRWLDATTLPVDASMIRPDRLAGLSAAGVAVLASRVGNSPCVLGDLFAITEIPGEPDVVGLEGDLCHLRDLGAGMESGRLVVRGDVGPRLGQEMKGGVIDLEGKAGPWAGAGMAGGLFRIKGAAGAYLGAAVPGQRRGMRDGMILVEGPVGEMAGLAMRRGLIAVAGPMGGGAGHGIVAGTIVCLGPVGRPLGMGMKRGSIVLADPAGSRPELLPTFEPAGDFRPSWLSVYWRRLAELGFPAPEGLGGRDWTRWNGDRVSGGQGEILTAL